VDLRTLFQLFCLAAVLLLALGPAASHLGWVRPLLGFSAWLMGFWIAALAVVVELIRLWRRGGPDPLLILPLALVLAGVVLVGWAARAPAVNDVSTDGVNPPRWAGDGVSSPTGGPTPAVLPLAPERALALVERVARGEEGWVVTGVDRGRLRLEAVVTTRVFRFQDQVAIEVRAAEGGSQVHMRSRSRVGKSDLGANASRIRRFMERLESLAATH
jgi:uncharacterized protein (DUF1499 family)